MTETTLTAEDLRAALPATSGALEMKGLDDTVRILRDGYGIPHVGAETEHDAFFGQGFATAQDRLWHMEYDRRRAYGRWAELVGAGAVDQDVLMRRLQIGPTVRGDYDSISSEARAMLDAYAAGVNAFMDSATSLPVEYRIVGASPERWEPWDCLAVFKVRHILMGVFEGKLWRARLVGKLGPARAARLLKGYQAGHLLIVPPGVDYAGPELDGLEQLSRDLQGLDWLEDGDSGSNSWALSGSRTSSGKPLLAGDPHRALDVPNVYYQNHVTCPEFDVVGLSFPGYPGFPHFGHNAHVAWCVTHAGADYQDLFMERFRGDGSAWYESERGWREADVRRETVSVRDGDPTEIDVTVTDHGPIIEGGPEAGHGLAFRYTATAETNPMAQASLAMLKATSADEIDESMREWVDPCNNFLFADVHGDIGYLTRGKVPVRSAANAWLPVPGWTGEHEWRGTIPFEEMPRSRNPDTGYIVTANNRIVGEEYPYYLALDYAPEYRARRILERLEDIASATVADMSSVHAERVSIPGRVYARLLAGADPLDEASSRAQAKLAAWDGSMEPDSVAATIYSAFRLRLDAAVLRHLVGDLVEEMLSAAGRGAPGHLRTLAASLVTTADRGDTSPLPDGQDWRSLAARALSEGVADLRERLGDDMESWRWGRVHHTAPRHTLSDAFPGLAGLLDPPRIPMGGDGDTPQAGSYSPARPFTMTGMSVARYVFDPGDWSRSAWVTPLGASGHPGSPHYADQADVWGRVDLIPMLYDWDSIESAAESRQTLEPA